MEYNIPFKISDLRSLAFMTDGQFSFFTKRITLIHFHIFKVPMNYC